MSRREKREKEEQEEKERKQQENRKKKIKTEEPKKESKKESKQKEEKGKSKKKDGIIKRLLKTILKTILILILLIVLLVGSFVAWLGFSNNWDLNKMLRKGAKQVALIATGQTEEDLAKLDPIYCLVMGISTDEDGALLTDTIIVCAYYPRTQQASMLSIPRDTFVGKSKATASGSDKINARYAIDGAEGILKEVEKLIGLDINNYVIVKNQGLIDVVNAIGGVDFDVPIDMDYDDWGQDLHIHLKAGQQKLNGDQAEGLVRFRKNNDNTGYPASYGSDDIGRMKTQREFISETIRQTLRFGNITKINELIQIGFKNIETNLDMDYVMKYAPAAVEFDVAALQETYIEGDTPKYPPNADPSKQLYFFEPYKEKLKKTIQEYFIFKQQEYDAGAEVAALKPENIKIQLLNASGDEAILEDTKKRLEEKGYNIEQTGITTVAKTTKVINRTEKKVEVVDELIDTLGYGNETEGKALSHYDFTIIVGQDMKQIIN